MGNVYTARPQGAISCNVKDCVIDCPFPIVPTMSMVYVPALELVAAAHEKIWVAWSKLRKEGSATGPASDAV